MTEIVLASLIVLLGVMTLTRFGIDILIGAILGIFLDRLIRRYRKKSTLLR